MSGVSMMMRFEKTEERYSCTADDETQCFIESERERESVCVCIYTVRVVSLVFLRRQQEQNNEPTAHRRQMRQSRKLLHSRCEKKVSVFAYYLKSM